MSARRALVAFTVVLCLLAGGNAAAAFAQTTITAAPPDSQAEQKAAAYCKVGDALSKHGLDEQARKAYEKALSTAWNAGCATAGLDRIPYAALARRAGDIVDFLPTLLVGLAAAAAALLLLLMIGYAPRGIGPWFQTHLPLRIVLHPRLSLAPLNADALGDDGKIGEAMVARIREQLQCFRTEALDQSGTGYELDRSASDQTLIDIVSDDSGLQTAVNKFGDVSNHTRVVTAILGVIYACLPIKRLALTGVVEPATAGIPTATIALQSGRSLAASTTVKAAAVAGTVASGDYLGLCSAAAVWTQYEIARELGDKVVAEDADSYRLVREGLDAMTAKDANGPARAAVLFDEAITVQPRNWAAHVNLFTALHAVDPSHPLGPRIKATMDEMREPSDQS